MVNYKFEIRPIPNNDRQIEIVYLLSDGQSRHVNSKLPQDGESIEDLVRKYEPLAFWDVPEIQPVWDPAPEGTVAKVYDVIPVTQV